MKRITALIVDDSALIRQMFGEFLSAEPDIEVLGTACDPHEAREKIKRLNPDVLTLDIEMPKMDGITFLEKIMALRPMPVIMVSTLTQKGAELSIRALELGAVDTVAKPVGTCHEQVLLELKAELISKVRAAATAHVARRIREHGQGGPVAFTPGRHAPSLIAVGASTGGVETLTGMFRRVPGNAPPIVVVQHMPERFTASFAARLDGISAVSVSEASEGERLMAGHAYLAPGNKHLKVVRQGGQFVCVLEDSPKISGHRPSVDVLFHSVAEAAGARATGVILTGMGKDGAEGLKAMRLRGARTIGQSEATCVVYGMPQAARKLGAVECEMPLAEIPQAMLGMKESAARDEKKRNM